MSTSNIISVIISAQSKLRYRRVCNVNISTFDHKFKFNSTTSREREFSCLMLHPRIFSNLNPTQFTQANNQV